MSDEGEKEPPGFAEERPLECSECRKEIEVRYTEVVGNHMTTTVMCGECPQLQARLHGSAAATGKEAAGVEMGLCCGECGTTLESVRMGSPLGCNVCYDVFEDVLLSELRAAGRVSRHVATASPSSPLHIGRAPGESKFLSSSIQLLALNEALNETLSREDYEQAAWLRDQIQAIKEDENGSK